MCVSTDIYLGLTLGNNQRNHTQLDGNRRYSPVLRRQSAHHYYPTKPARIGINIAMDCLRSSLLEYEFPPPIWYPGHRPGSTISAWARPWTTLYFWSPADIAAAFSHYWTSTVTANDKNALITPRGFFDGLINHMGMCDNLQQTSCTPAPFLMREYQWPMNRLFREDIPYLSAIFIPLFTCTRTLFLASQIIFEIRTRFY